MTDPTMLNEVSQVVELKDKGLNYDQISEILGFSARTARRRYAARLVQDVLADDEAIEGELVDFPQVQSLDITVDGPYIPEDKGAIERFAPLVRTGDAMVTCDWHIPLHDPVLINRMINCARINDIKTLIIGGDYFHMEAFSSFLPAQPEASLEQERYDGNLIMKTLLETFDKIDFIWGNHDFRLTRKLGFKKSFEECMRWMLGELTEDELAKIRFSELDYMLYYPDYHFRNLGEKATIDQTLEVVEGKCFRVCHPRNFSSVPLTVGRKLAVKHSSSIITAHSHHHAIGAAPNGVDLVIEGGGFFDKRRTEYIQKSTANHEWVQGFTMFKNGLPHLISPAMGNDILFRKD